jgi:phosphoribosylaminoimidazolecarboxamide formyltransferase/IMP cyclohydrolase
VETVSSGAGYDESVEQIDIGGPAMVRASAKNHANVAIVVSPERYPAIIEAIEDGGTDLELRKQLALEAFSHTANYDAAVSSWLAGQLGSERLSLGFTKSGDLRYGENSHQAASLFVDGTSGVASAKLLGGKEMSYNNFVDIDAAVRAAYDFAEPAVAIIKHANPCGVAIAEPGAEDPITSAYMRAHLTDPVSAFGGVVAANREVTAEFAASLSKVFTEVIAAPGFSPEALEILSKKKNLRILELSGDYMPPSREIRQISGGLLVQEPDSFEDLDVSAWKLVSGKPASPALMADLEFAWRASRAVKSNAILLAKDLAAVGIGMGQVNRLDSCHLAIQRAGDRAAGSVAASDAFFPFADGLEVLVAGGISAVVQPGGSVRDEEVIAAAVSAGITMYFTGERHFYH